ncbi:hypothetical protein GCM10020229_65670 [Kitasatospora albolonga]
MLFTVLSYEGPIGLIRPAWEINPFNEQSGSGIASVDRFGLIIRPDTEDLD